MFSEETHDVDDEANSLESSDSIIKKGIFTAFHPLVCEEYFNIFFKILLIIIETLQIISFAFKDIMLPLWKSTSLASSMASFFKYFMIMPYLATASFSFYIVIVYLISTLNFCMFLLIVYFNLKGQEDKKPQNQFIFQFFKMICEILPQILYMPMLEILISLFKCSFQASSGKWIHSIYPDSVCYEGIYILHLFIVGLVLIFLVILTALINLLYYDCRLKSPNFLAKSSGRIAIFTFCYKTVIIILFTTLPDESNTVLIAFFGISSFLIFSEYLNVMPHYNLLAFKLFLLKYALISWTGFMLIFGKITIDVNFDAILFIYIIGIVLLVLIIFMRKEFRYDILLLNANRIETIELFIHHIQYLSLLCEHYKTDPTTGLLLDGYVQYHMTICQEEDCPCKKELLSSKKHQKIMSSGQDEQILRVTYMINSFFMNILQKKPYNPSLRIKYSLFLLDRLNQKQLALQEISTASYYKPALDEEFLIYRFKRVIETELLDKKKDDSHFGFDSINELALNSLVKQIKAHIERSSSQHLEFWSQLSEDVPDISLLFVIGTKITLLNTLLEEDWERFQRMNILLPSLYRTYANYLFTILNDKYGSVKIYGKLDNENYRGLNSTDAKKTIVSEFVNNSNPVIFISGEEENLGTIVNLNQTAAAILGYSKSELMNKKINMIQPSFIAEKHDQILENYLMKNESRLLNKETLLPVKNKNGYLNPLYFTIRCVPFALQGTQFYASIRAEKTFKNLIYLYCDSDGVIELFSSSCINLLILNKKNIAKRKHYITEIIPSFFDNLSNYKEKNGSLGDVQIQTKLAYDVSNYTTTMPPTINQKSFTPSQNQIADGVQFLTESNSNINIDDENSPNFLKLIPKNTEKIPLPHAMPINVFPFENKAFDLQSYLIRIEYIEPKNCCTTKIKLRNNLGIEAKHQGVFSFNYDIFANSYNGEILDGQEADIDIYLDQLKSSYSHRMEQSNRDSGVQGPDLKETSKLFKKLEQNMLLKQKEGLVIVYEAKDWGKGIRTFRLLGDRLHDLEELKRDEESNSEEKYEENENIASREKKNERKQEDESSFLKLNLKTSKNIFRTRNNFFNYLKSHRSEKNSFVINLHYISIIVLLILGLICSLNHFLVANEYESNQKSYNLIDWSNQRIAQTQLIIFNLMELSLLNIGIYNKTQSSNYEQDLRNQLEINIFALESLQNRIVLNSFGLSSEHQTLYSENSIPVAYLSNLGVVSFQNFDINQITSQIISKAYGLIAKPLDSFNSYNNDFFYLQYNLLNDYYLAMRQETSYFIDELIARNYQSSTMIIAIIAVSVVVLIASIFILVPIYCFALAIQQQILLIFLDISSNNIKRYFF